MKRIYTLLLIFFVALGELFATGEPSTYFNIFVPPNNNSANRDVALIVTAIYDSTSFQIIDDGMDGDTDDSYTGMLMAGQSYILYIKDNGVNDDAGANAKQDGDYFTISSNKLVYASQSTNSDWQFDYVPSVNKSSVGTRFIVYSPMTSYSNRDLNAFAYEDGTAITVKAISTIAKTTTGINTVNINSDSVVMQRTINIGQDLIYTFLDGRNIMESGHTYLVESNKPISLQYGALYQNSRDGGGYVPSANGSSSGEMFYFTIPYQANYEQELRIVSWDSNNTVDYSYYDNGTWQSIKSWNLDELETGDWVGKDQNVNYPNVLRVSCSAGKKVSVFTANWLETGNPGTSDIATMVSSKTGTTSGTEFLCYMAPPGYENNVTDPFTNNKFVNPTTHLYLFAKDSANVIVKDIYTDGQDFYKTFSISAGRYADCALSLSEWQAIYNGTGSANDGNERPYLKVVSDGNISVMNTNFNDNWMMYFGSSLEQSFGQTSQSSENEGAPGDTVTVVSTIVLNTKDDVTGVSGEVTVGSGAIPTNSVFIDSASNTQIQGIISTTNEGSVISYDSLPNLDTNGNYQVITEITLLAGDNDGGIQENNEVITVETTITGEVNGQIQQSVVSEGVSVDANDASNLIYSQTTIGDIVNTATDSWNASWVDIDNDNDQDLFLASRDLNEKSRLYRNNGNGTFSDLTYNELVLRKRKTMSSAWADIDNDGDMDVVLVNNNNHPVELFTNDGNGNFTLQSAVGFPTHPGYYHGGSWADINNDGFVDLIITNYMPTRFHEVYMNNGNGTFSERTNTPISQESNYTVASSWVDYNNDGLMDLFIPNNLGENNSLFKNTGNGFEKITTGDIVNQGGFSVASCWADVDADGDFDVFVANTSDQKDYFYFNNGDETFTADTTLAFTTKISNVHGCSWIDVDNDMDLDLYLTDDAGAKHLYIQQNGTFVNKVNEVVVTNYGKSYGQAIADFNGDGYQDIFVSTHSNDDNHLFKNNGGNKNYLQIELQGTISNESAIGAKVSVLCGGKWQHSFVQSQTGYGSQNSLVQHFGLDTNSMVDSVVIHWPSGFAQTEVNFQANQYVTIPEESSTLISGYVYHDENGNCQKDSNEHVLANHQLTVKPLGKIVSTNALGYYETRVSQGEYEISYNNQTYWASACTAPGITASAIPSTITGQNIGVQKLANGPNLKVQYATTAWRRGFANQSLLTISNNGTEAAYNVEVNLTYPSTFSFNASSTPATNQVDSTITWVIDTLDYGTNLSISITDSILLTTLIGETYSVSASIESDDTDLDTTDNVFTYTDVIVGAIDPNDLLAWPMPTAGQSLAYITPLDTITYKVRFQNVGTYMAENVVVTAKFSDDFKFDEMEVLNTSHDAVFERDNDGRITWKFNHIQLPDSNSNEAESHGYVSYKVPVQKTLKHGKILDHQASIVFDFEAPIMTNITHHQVISRKRAELGSLNVFPVPAVRGEVVYINIDEDVTSADLRIKRLQVFNEMGSLLVDQDCQNKQEVLRTDYFQSGTYILIATDENGGMHSGKLQIL